MKTLYTLLILIALSVQNPITTFAQRNSIARSNTTPEIGKPMPDFTLDNVLNYPKTRVSLKDFKGKWLFLDFWFSGCTTCIKSLPKVDAFQKQFHEHAQFLMVGINEEKIFFGKGIEDLFRKLEKKQNLKIPAAFDSVLWKPWNIGSMPHIIIIDPEGIVRSITNGQDMTADKIEQLLAGEAVTFFQKDIELPGFDVKSLDSTTLIYHSALAKWNGEKQSLPDVTSYARLHKVPCFQASMAALYQLYNLAYMGMADWLPRDSLYYSVYPRPVLEMKDTTPFNYDHAQFKGLYNYSLTLSPQNYSTQTIMAAMQNDLESAFGYTVSIEKRAMPVWKLIARPGAAEKLRTKGEHNYFSDEGGSGGAAGFTLRNNDINIFLDLVKRYLNDWKIPFFDETGIAGNIDITVDALMTDRHQVIQALRSNGLDLILGKKDLHVIVIKENIDKN